jgi:hypothetical protein
MYPWGSVRDPKLYFLLAYWRPMKNRAGSESVIQWYGPVTDPKNCLEGQKLRKTNKNFLYIILVSGKNNDCKTTATPKCLGWFGHQPPPPPPREKIFLSFKIQVGYHTKFFTARILIPNAGLGQRIQNKDRDPRHKITESTVPRYA